jgi:glycosyltransferase involved in cell wall biosynthesis
MPAGPRHHIVVVEAFQGRLEFLSDDPLELSVAEGLGLPWDELAVLLDCRVTVLGWEKWYAYEGSYGSPFTWAARPATRPIAPKGIPDPSHTFHSGLVRRVPVAARDPGSGRALTIPLSPLARGLVSERDLLFFVSYCLREELIELARRDGYQLVVFPLWGGLGYLTQLSRAMNAEVLLRAPTVVVATDPSSIRQQVNQEGAWNKQATMRRQMEDVSVALADEVLAFGPRGSNVASRRRLPERSAPIQAPRRLPSSLLEAMAQAAEEHRPRGEGLSFFLCEPQQADAGVLCALDAVSLLNQRGTRLDRPLAASGPDAIFAPMRPRGFREYWSARGFVRDLIRERQWSWEDGPADAHRASSRYAVRLYPSFFEHLPNVWQELARGSLVVLSAASAEGLSPGEPVASELLINGETTPERLANKMEQLAHLNHEELDALRRELCQKVLVAHRGDARIERLKETAEMFSRLMSSTPCSPSLGRAALLLLDRRRDLRDLAGESALPRPDPASQNRSLTVVVTCYRLGELVREAVESVWESRRRPDEVLVIDDGSDDAETLECLRGLERKASECGLPLRVIHQPNRGLAGARNRGLAEAAGDYISFLDGDDLVDPEFYQLAVPLLTEYPELGGVAAWADIFGESVEPGFWNDPQPELPALLVQNSVVVPCVSPTEVIRALGGYDSNLRYNYEDWELSIRLLASGWPIVTLPSFLVKYRVRPDSLYRTMTDVQNQVMRERIYSEHQQTVSRFAFELPMMIEDRLGRLIYPSEKPPSLLRRLVAIRSNARRLFGWLAR